MDKSPEDVYYKISRIFLWTIGLWPSRHRKFSRIYRAFTLCLLLSIVFVQFAAIVKYNFDLDTSLYVLSLCIPSLAAIMKYNYFLIRLNKISTLMSMINDDWDELKKDKNSLKILREYAEVSKLFLIVLSGSTAVILLGICFLHFVPRFLDMLIPLNEPRPLKLFILAEYFVDQDKYFYPLMVHFIVSFSLVIMTVVSTEAICLVYVQHICGLFKVAGYKLEHALDGIQQDIVSDKNVISCARIIHGINVHNRAIKFTEHMWSTFMLSYFCMVLLGVGSISISLLRFYRATKTLKNYDEIIASTFTFVAQMCHMFLANYFAQRVIDHSGAIFDNTYNSSWYTASVQAQKLLLFVLRRSIKNSAFVTGGIFTASLEGFSTLTSMSLSYFTVIYSL